MKRVDCCGSKDSKSRRIWQLNDHFISYNNFNVVFCPWSITRFAQSNKVANRESAGERLGLWLLALVTDGSWHVTCDMCHLTCDIWHTDLELVKKCTQARFFRWNSYPKERKLQQINNSNLSWVSLHGYIYSGWIFPIYFTQIVADPSRQRQARLHTVGFGLTEGQPTCGVGQRPSLRALYPSTKS